MDKITLDQLHHIISAGYGWCVSIFMPAHKVGREMEQNPIRFKNLLRQAEERLLSKGLRPGHVQDLLRDAHRLLLDQGFWRRQSRGLAVFFSGEMFEFFRLPVDFVELVVISDRFHVKPLLPILTSDGTFYILALSQNQLRLLKGTRYTVDETDLEDLPRNLSDVFPDGIPEKQLQFHTGSPSGSGKRPGVFHGHDISNDIRNNIQRWFRMIDRHVSGLLAGEPAPLVLAAVEPLFPVYREVNTCPHLMEVGIPGNPEGMNPEDLHGKALAIVEPVFKRERESGYARYRQLAGTGQTTTSVPDAVLAAFGGRIEVLFVAVGVQVWGRVDPEENTVDVHGVPEPGDGDLLDLAAIQTLIRGGRVFAVSPGEVPDGAHLAAVLRY